ncbi:GreA/GreB family elongation factor [Candidatus Woesearchaeota archaeon]|nr:GreA/GreB family elongation factor [Candidatus Woesearchaeota archaeon]
MVIYFTSKGYNLFKERIGELETKLRALQLQVQEVAETGGDDWHDNAGYEMLTDEVRVYDRRINELYEQLNQAKIVECPSSYDRVALGCNVSVSVNGRKGSFKIVAMGEEDPDNNKILYSSPLARAILGHDIGDVVETNFGSDEKKIEILDIGP